MLAEDFEYLNSIIKNGMATGERKIIIAHSYFKNAYLVNLSYDDFVIIIDNDVLAPIISL